MSAGHSVIKMTIIKKPNITKMILSKNDVFMFRNKVNSEVISLFLRCDEKIFKEIFRKHQIVGAGVILLNNMYLSLNKTIAGKVNDLEKIVLFLGTYGKIVLNSLYSAHFYSKRGAICYPRAQLITMNETRLMTPENLNREWQKIRFENTRYPSAAIADYDFIYGLLSNIIKKTESQLPTYIRRGIRKNIIDVPGIDKVNFYRIMNVYVSIDPSYIGFMDVVKIHAYILHKNMKDVVKLLKHSRVWESDEARNIIYDPRQRMMHNLPSVPSDEEVAAAASRSKDCIYKIMRLKNL